MRITNDAGLPEAIVEAVRRDPYDAGDCDISLTRLIGPPQIRVLERLHADELVEDAADRIWALVGQIGHGILERSALRDITERRLFAEVAGWRISGQLDNLVLLPDGSLQDYKFTSVWAVLDGPKPEWVAQLNCLRLLLSVNGYPTCARLQVVAILRDWSKGKARAGGGYPRHQVRVIDVPRWGLADTAAYLAERVHLHQLADDCAETGQPLPECTAAERWARPDVWAVHRPGRSSAIRVLSSEAEARALAVATPGGYVQHRPGESIRCADYCSVSQFCRQRAAERSAI